MEYLENLLGVQLGLPARFIIAFIFVLLLIAITAWIIRRVASGRGGFGGSLRARQDRLAVVDAAHVDSKRRLVLVRRDNVEHLILIGGPADVVVEAGIGAMPSALTERARAEVAEPVRPGGRSVEPPRPLRPAEPTLPPRLSDTRPSRPAPAPVRAAEPSPPPRAPEPSAPARAAEPPVPPRPATPPPVPPRPAAPPARPPAPARIPAAAAAAVAERAVPERAVPERAERPPAPDVVPTPARRVAPATSAPDIRRPAEQARPVPPPSSPPPAAPSAWPAQAPARPAAAPARSPEPTAVEQQPAAPQNREAQLEEMAQRLEAALKRPLTPSSGPGATSRTAAAPPPAAAPPQPPPPAAPRPSEDSEFDLAAAVAAELDLGESDPTETSGRDKKAEKVSIYDEILKRDT